MTDPSRTDAVPPYETVLANRPLILTTGAHSDHLWSHVSNYYGTDLVLRDGPVFELEDRHDPAIGSIVVTFADGTRMTVDDYFEASSMVAMIVLRGGAVVYERAKSLRRFDRRVWFSCSKTVVATMVAMLEAEGRIDIATSVSSHLPELAGSAWDEVTVEQALDMATGLDATEHEEPDARTNPERGWYQWAVSIGLFGVPGDTGQAPFDVLGRMTRRKPPHVAFEYNSINTFVCQLIAERIAGVPLAEFFGERVWRRIGAQGDGYLVLSRQGRAMGFGFMNSSLRDLARYGMIFTPSQTKLSAEPILPAAAAARVHQGHRPDMFARGSFGSALASEFPLNGIANRYQWDLVTPDGDQFKAGFAGQGLYVSAPADTVVAFFSTGTQRDEGLGAWAARTMTRCWR